jgi:hypothetical protein
MATEKKMDSYDEIKNMLSKVRKIQELGRTNSYGMIEEQVDSEEGDEFQNLEKSVGNYMNKPPQSQPTNNPVPPQQSKEGEENEDFAVINNVEVEIHSEDPEDLELSEEEKGKISQVIDDFRKEVSEIVEFDKLDIYEENAKLSGKISDVGLSFMISTGNDSGLYLSNASMLKIDDESIDIINKLRTFEPKFSGAINDLLVNRSTT